MATPVIKGNQIDIAPDCVFGDDVVIEADEIQISPGCKIGWSGDDDFRTPPGVRIKAQRLQLGPGVTLGRAVRIEGGDFRLDEGVRIMRHSTIHVADALHLGAYGTVGEFGEISGRRVRIGQELWMLPNVKIGGGSAFEVDSALDAGHFLHLGIQTMVNTARPVVLGDEVGLGTRTAIYTHGAYPSRLMGFPVAFDGVEIGDFSWVPGAVINPGVRIGRNCVIGVNSLVTRSIPDGCLAGGSPAKVIRSNCYPAPLDPAAQLVFFEEFLGHYARLIGTSALPRRVMAAGPVLLEDEKSVYAAVPELDAAAIRALPARPRTLIIASSVGEEQPPIGWTVYDTGRKRISGTADSLSVRLKQELRRYGIRFYSRERGDDYFDWLLAKEGTDDSTVR